MFLRLHILCVCYLRLLVVLDVRFVYGFVVAVFVWFSFGLMCLCVLVLFLCVVHVLCC